MATASEPRPQSPTVWFPAKRYGWGWGPPVAWQGWAVLIAWTAAVVTIAPFLAGRHWVGFAGFMVGMTAALVAVCYAKGERPRWRWGG